MTQLALFQDANAHCDACSRPMRARGTQAAAPLLCAGCKVDASGRYGTNFGPGWTGLGDSVPPEPWEL